MRWGGRGHVALFVALLVVRCCGLTQPEPATAPHPNPFGRPIRVCTLPEIGFMHHTDPSATWNVSITKPLVYSSRLGNLRDIDGFDMSVANFILKETLGWEFEMHVYKVNRQSSQRVFDFCPLVFDFVFWPLQTYAAAFYHATRGGDCDLGIGPFGPFPERLQCHATPAAGESWGTSEACPAFQSPKNATTTDSMWLAGCCGKFLSPYYQVSSCPVTIPSATSTPTPTPTASFSSPAV
jgi:hypothetical protein